MQQQQPKRVLMILTNVDKMRDGTEKPTGSTIGSVASAYHVFQERNYQIDFLSPSGGYCPIDQHSLLHHGKDEVCAKYMADQNILAKMSQSMKPSDLEGNNNNNNNNSKLRDYSIIYVPGGIGQLWDVAQSDEIAKLIARFYENCNGFIGSHGLSALLNVKLSDGQYLLKDKTVTGFTKDEERDSCTAANVPFSIEDEANKRDAIFVHEGLWQNCFKTSERLCTAQNQKSATQVAEMLVQLSG